MWEVVGEAKKNSETYNCEIFREIWIFDFFNKGKVFNVDKCLIKGFNFCGVSCKKL